MRVRRETQQAEQKRADALRAEYRAPRWRREARCEQGGERTAATHTTTHGATVGMAKMNESEFTLIERLGQGAFGIVYRGSQRSTQQTWAIKVIDLDAALEEIDSIRNEIAVLATCRHPQIVGYGGSYVLRSKLYILMELLVGSARDLMRPKNTGPFEEAVIASFARDTLSGLDYLHRNLKIHRDIKGAPARDSGRTRAHALTRSRAHAPQGPARARAVQHAPAGNILVGRDGVVKLADFGITAQLAFDKAAASAFAGTAYFMAPEIIRRQAYNSKADIWSFGIMLVELAMGTPPYEELDANRAHQIILAQPPFQLPATFSSQLRSLVAAALTVDPTAVHASSRSHARAASSPRGSSSAAADSCADAATDERWALGACFCSGHRRRCCLSTSLSRRPSTDQSCSPSVSPGLKSGAARAATVTTTKTRTTLTTWRVMFLNSNATGTSRRGPPSPSHCRQRASGACRRPSSTATTGDASAAATRRRQSTPRSSFSVPSRRTLPPPLAGGGRVGGDRLCTCSSCMYL